MEVKNPCLGKTDRCINCHSHFNNLRPTITDAIITKQFKKDIENYDEILEKILDCGHQYFNELHKFEKKINGIFIFRAKKDYQHFVYAIQDNKIILLKVFSNFTAYKKFLDNDQEILKSTSDV